MDSFAFSLYPSVSCQEENPFPQGVPEVLVTQEHLNRIIFKDNKAFWATAADGVTGDGDKRIFGLIQCKVLAPLNLHLPFLLQRYINIAISGSFLSKIFVYF